MSLTRLFVISGDNNSIVHLFSRQIKNLGKAYRAIVWYPSQCIKLYPFPSFRCDTPKSNFLLCLNLSIQRPIKLHTTRLRITFTLLI